MIKPAFLLCLALSACATFPDVGATARPVVAPAPQLVPIDGILMQADAQRPVGSVISDTEARAAALRARAARLRGQ